MLIVYVQLLNEGTLVFRPVQAIAVAEGVAQLGTPADYDPTTEEWEFPPGSSVRIEERTLDGGPVYVAVCSLG